MVVGKFVALAGLAYPNAADLTLTTMYDDPNCTENEFWMNQLAHVGRRHIVSLEEDGWFDYPGRYLVPLPPYTSATLAHGSKIMQVFGGNIESMVRGKRLPLDHPPDQGPYEGYNPC